MTITVGVEYYGIDFTVSGNFEKGYAETQWDPGEGDGFDDYTIYIGDVDVTDVLMECVIEGILEKATEYAIDSSDPRYRDEDD